MQHDFASVRAATVLEQIDALPCPEHEPPVKDKAQKKDEHEVWAAESLQERLEKEVRDGAWKVPVIVAKKSARQSDAAPVVLYIEDVINFRKSCTENIYHSDLFAK